MIRNFTGGGGTGVGVTGWREPEEEWFWSQKISGLQFHHIGHALYIWDQPHFYYSGLVIPGVEAFILWSCDKSLCFSFQTHTINPLMAVCLINISLLTSLWVLVMRFIFPGSFYLFQKPPSPTPTPLLFLLKNKFYLGLKGRNIACDIK